MKYPVYNQEGKEEGEITLPREIFEVKLNADLVHQIVISQMGNKRQISAHTKNRAEVRGGGKKPWKQKGTGKARVGSTRSPLWKGGGVTFGPRKDKIYEREIPKKMRKKALFMVLSEKAKNSQIVILDKLEMDAPKTKKIAMSLSKLPCKSQSLLIALAKYDKNTFLSARNLKKTGISEARNLNIVDLMTYKYLLMTKDGIKTIKETFAK